jgi:hypothetical protein
MTVKELIEFLQTVPEDATVEVYDSSFEYVEVKSVKYNKGQDCVKIS